MGDDIEALVFKTFDIPPMPEVATRVVKAAANEKMSASEMAEIISADPGLTAKTLRIANSALFAPTTEVESLQQAVVALGFKTVKNLAIAASSRILHQHPGPVQDALWKHSVSVAVSSSCIGERHPGISNDEAFTAGILHDVGKFILHNHDPESFEEAQELRWENGISSVDAEFEIFGFDHTAVGTAVLRRWGLPEILIAAVRFHQNVSVLKNAKPEIRRLAACVNLGNRISYTLKHGVDVPYVNAGDTQEAVVGVLELDPQGLLDVIDQTRNLYEQELAAFA